MTTTSRHSEDWAGFVDLIEKVMAQDDLLPQVVAGVRAMVQEVASLPVADIAGHTRALLTAAARALAGRRGPTEAELAFVEELAVTRASQGIPIEVVLGAIHVSERAIWARARELAEQEGIASAQLLDARELYDDWAEAVRSRLIQAHRDAKAERGGAVRDRDVAVLRRLLEGGSAATLAAAEAGLPPAGLWVLVARSGTGGRSTSLDRLLPDRAPSLTAPVGDTLVAVTSAGPSGRGATRAAREGGAVGVAGPVGAEEVGSAHRLALSVVPAAEAIGRTGLVHVGQVATVVAVQSRTDIATALVARHRDARAELGAGTAAVARAVTTWLEADRDTGVAAGRLFVHANTVRNRVQRFAGATGIDVHGTFGALDAWWLCRSWLADEH